LAETGLVGFSCLDEILLRFPDPGRRECCFELGRRAVTERAVQAAGVEPAEVFDDRELELAAGAPDAVADQFGLERVDEALGERIVVASPTEPTDAKTWWSASSWV
jgi:hypothetical protein